MNGRRPAWAGPDVYYLARGLSGLQIFADADTAKEWADQTDGRVLPFPFKPLPIPDRFRITLVPFADHFEPSSFVELPDPDTTMLAGGDIGEASGDEIRPRTRTDALAEVARQNRDLWESGRLWYLAFEIGQPAPLDLARVWLYPNGMGTLDPCTRYPVRVVRPSGPELQRYAIL